jgi:hypothetical protein
MPYNVIKVQDNPIHSPQRMSLRKERYIYLPELNTSLRNDDTGNAQINTPFSFFPPIPVLNLPPIWQPLPGNDNYRLLLSRLVRLEEEIKQLKERIGSLDSFLRCVNFRSSANCTGLRHPTVPAAAYIPIPTGGLFPFFPSQPSSAEGSGVLVSSMYNRPAGTDGHGTVTIQHFGAKPNL